MEGHALVPYRPPELPDGSSQSRDHRALARRVEIYRGFSDPLLLWPILMAIVHLLTGGL